MLSIFSWGEVLSTGVSGKMGTSEGLLLEGVPIVLGDSHWGPELGLGSQWTERGGLGGVQKGFRK